MPVHGTSRPEVSLLVLVLVSSAFAFLLKLLDASRENTTDTFFVDGLKSPLHSVTMAAPMALKISSKMFPLFNTFSKIPSSQFSEATLMPFTTHHRSFRKQFVLDYIFFNMLELTLLCFSLCTTTVTSLFASSLVGSWATFCLVVIPSSQLVLESLVKQSQVKLVAAKKNIDFFFNLRFK